MFSCFELQANSAAQKVSSTEQQSSKKSLTWLVEDKSENLNLSDDNSPSNSAASAVERYVINHLTNYNVTIERVAIKRINHLLQTQDNVCAGNRAKLAEREKYSLFSNPQSFYLTHKFYRYDKEQPLPPEYFNSDGELLSIKQIFDHQPIHRIGLVDGVSFGRYLDEKVRQLDDKNKYYRGGTYRVVALESMLYSARVDYLLALPVDMNPNEQQQKLLEQYDIAGAPPFLIAHFSCSKSDFGQSVISDINQVLDKTYAKDTFNDINGRWYSEKDLEKIQGYLQQNFLDKTTKTTKP